MNSTGFPISRWLSQDQPAAFGGRPSAASGLRTLGVLTLTVASMVVGMAGCASPVEPALPKVVTPSGWMTAAPGGEPMLPDPGRGWERFDDPVLPSLVDAALAASPTLASAAARVAQARATRVSAGAAAWPAVDGAANVSHGRSDLSLPVGTSASLGAQASWEIDLFGALEAGRRAAQARLEGAQAGWHDARVSVAAETATSYIALRACEAQLAQTQIDADSRAETARLTELSAASGFAAPADAALTRASAAQGRIQVLSQRATCDQQRKSLVEVTALGEVELTRLLRAGTARIPMPAPMAPFALPAELLGRRPDLAQAGRNVAAAAADSSQSAARELPQVTLSGSFDIVRLHGGGSDIHGATWVLGPLTVSFPLFDAGRRAASTAAARAAYDESVALYQARFRQAVREVEVALVALQSTAERQRDAERAARDFELSLRATAMRQQGGLASLFDLETARRNAVTAQITVIDLQRERASSWISLFRALGGGFSDAALAQVSTTAPRP